MQREFPSNKASLFATARHMRWIALALSGAAAMAFVWFTNTNDSRAPPPFSGALGFERTQAQQTMTTLGYREVSGLEKHDDGSWRARAHKNGTYWQLRISPYGIVSAHIAPQLSIVLE